MRIQSFRLLFQSLQLFTVLVLSNEVNTVQPNESQPILFPSVLLHSDDWVHLGRVSPSTPVSFMLALHHGKQDEILRAWEQLSNPLQPQYLHYPTREHVLSLAQPRTKQLQDITQWLETEVCSPARRSSTLVWSAFKDTVTVHMSASEMESFLGGAEIHSYRSSIIAGSNHRSSKVTWARTSLTTLMPFIPTHVHSAVAYVHGLSHWPALVEAQTIRCKKEHLPAAHARRHDNRATQIEGASSEPLLKAASTLPGMNAPQSPALFSVPWDPESDFVSYYADDGEIELRVYLFCSATFYAFTDSATQQAYCISGSFRHIFDHGTVTLTPSNGIPLQVSFNSSMLSHSLGLPVLRQTIPLPNYLQYKVNVALNYGDYGVSMNYPFVVEAMGEVVNPAFLKTVYGVPAKLSASAAAKIGIAAEDLGGSGDEHGFFSPSDLALYLSDYSLPTNASVVFKDFSQIPEQNDPTNPDGETNMDIQLAMGILASYNATGVIYHANDTEALVDIMNGLMLDTPLPSVLSISYGGTMETRYTESGYINHTNTRFQMLGLLGVTVVVSSGDHGAYRPLPSFSSPSYAQTCAQFNPSYPGSSPYVTSVGSTVLKVDNAGDCPREVQCSLESGAGFTSGGGFSISQPAPYYQQAAINGWLNDATCQSKRPKNNTYDVTKRALPDLVLLGENYDTVQNGHFYITGGTSASAPTFAGLIALVNDLRVASGQPVLGPVNGLLYYAASQDARTFQDVTEGGNRCLEPNSGCCPDGYNACAGFDPVSGLGAPRFQFLQQFFNVSFGTPDPSPWQQCQSSSSSTGGATGSTGSDVSSSTGGGTGTTSGAAFPPTKDEGERRTLLIIIAVVSSLACAAISALILIGICLFRRHRSNPNQESSSENIQIGVDSLSDRLLNEVPMQRMP